MSISTTQYIKWKILHINLPIYNMWYSFVNQNKVYFLLDSGKKTLITNRFQFQNISVKECKNMLKTLISGYNYLFEIKCSFVIYKVIKCSHDGRVLEFCKATGLRVVNGGCCEDSNIGNFCKTRNI